MLGGRDSGLALYGWLSSEITALVELCLNLVEGAGRVWVQERASSGDTGHPRVSTIGRELHLECAGIDGGAGRLVVS